MEAIAQSAQSGATVRVDWGYRRASDPAAALPA